MALRDIRSHQHPPEPGTAPPPTPGSAPSTGGPRGSQGGPGGPIPLSGPPLRGIPVNRGGPSPGGPTRGGSPSPGLPERGSQSRPALLILRVPVWRGGRFPLTASLRPGAGSPQGGAALARPGAASPRPSSPGQSPRSPGLAPGPAPMSLSRPRRRVPPAPLGSSATRWRPRPLPPAAPSLRAPGRAPRALSLVGAARCRAPIGCRLPPPPAPSLPASPDARIGRARPGWPRPFSCRRAPDGEGHAPCATS